MISESTATFITQTVRNELGDCGPVEILLFGSQANGKATLRSDIDIAIKAQTKLSFASWQKIENIFEESEVPQKIDVVDFHRVSPEFQKIILNTSIRLL